MAFLLDTVLLSAGLAVLAVALPFPVDGAEPFHVPFWHRAVTVVAGILYFVVGWSRWAATPGQRLASLQVVASDRARLPAGRAFARWAALGGPLWVIGSTVSGGVGLAALFGSAAVAVVLLTSVVRHETGRGLHDRISGSVVHPRGLSDP